MTLRFLDLDHNYLGRDWVCGDLHGTLDEFKSSLESAGFDCERDRLFCVGDLHDRGPDSLSCLKLIGEPWFFTVDSNHNDIMLSYLDGNLSQKDAEDDGAKWLMQKPLHEQRRISLALRMLPTCIRIGLGTDARVNIFHAEYLGSDADLDSGRDLLLNGERVTAETSLKWGRVLAEQVESGVESSFPCSQSLSASFVGHTPVEIPFEFQNHVFMDCGTWNHSNKSKSRGGPALMFPLLCMSTGTWFHCEPDGFASRFVESLASRIHDLSARNAMSA